MVVTGCRLFATLKGMSLTDIVILALTQGSTEFLPISSSGHLAIVRLLFGIPDTDGTTFDAFLHLGTLAALLVYYWRVWRGMFRSVFVQDTEGQDKQQLFAKLAVATVPGAIAGYFWQNSIDAFLRSPLMLAGGLVITALTLLLADTVAKSTRSIYRADFKDAVYIGLAQAVALVPSISRSGMTIAAGRWRGLSRQQATHFSFLMSAPIIAGAGLASLGQLLLNNNFTALEIVIGFGISFLAGLASVHTFIKLMEKVSLLPFVIYLFAVAALLLILR